MCVIRRLLVLVLVSLSSLAAVVYGETHPCGFDALLKLRQEADPTFQTRLDSLEAEMQRGLMAKPQTGTYVIPTWVHVVHSGVAIGVDENITDEQIRSQIDATNEDLSQLFDTRIELCFIGVSRVADASLAVHDICSEELALKSSSRKPSDKFLNIWIVKDIIGTPCAPEGIGGYAHLPGEDPALDGIVVVCNLFGSVRFHPGGSTPPFHLDPNYNQGRVLVHELGHYLDLYHTFQGGCAAPGDYCDDTEPEETEHFHCPVGLNSCGGAASDPDPIHNYMAYTDQSCTDNFTPDQTARMHAAIAMFRSTLVSPANVIASNCPAASEPIFVADETQVCELSAVNFQCANSASNVTAWEWDFPGGTPSSSTLQNPVITYNDEGSYDVSLTITDNYGNKNSLTKTDYMYVIDCTPIKSSQGVWCFGDKAGLDFRTGKAVAFLGSNMNADEGCVSQCDDLGNLLFYTNSREIYDKNHALISASLAGHTSSSQSCVSVPDPNPNFPRRYYLFTTDNETGFATLRYTLVNVTATSITLSSVNTRVTPVGQEIGEQLIAVPHCNQADYWIIVHSDGTPDQFWAYLLDASGVASTPVISSCARPGSVGCLEASPDGTILAQTTKRGHAPAPDAAALYNFDPMTGEITHWCDLSIGNYGSSFSPDSKLLYVSDWENWINTYYQFDLTVADPGQTAIEVGHGPYIWSNMQLGPDGKIYISPRGRGYLHVINYPNRRCSATEPNACGFNYDGPDLLGQASGLGLPNMIDAHPVMVQPSFAYTVSNCYTVAFRSHACGQQYNWDFGDGSAGSSVKHPVHTYSAPGTFNVTLTVTMGGVSASCTQSIVLGMDPPTIAGPTTTCDPVAYYSTNAKPGQTCSWTITGGLPTSATGNNVEVGWSSSGGTISLTVSDATTGCQATSTLTVTAVSPDAHLWIQDSPIDNGSEPSTGPLESEDIWVRNQPNGFTNTTHQPPIAATTNYVYVRVRNSGCDGTGQLHLYWTKGATPSGPDWDAHWKNYRPTMPPIPGCPTGVLYGDEITSVPIPVSVARYSEQIYEIPWTVPDPSDFLCFGSDSRDFILLARIETSPTYPYGMTSPEQPGTFDNVQNNNKIAWKNVEAVWDRCAVRIEDLVDENLGHHHFVDVVNDKACYCLGGFDLFVAHEANALTPINVYAGTVFQNCGWEYFVYRLAIGGPCGDGVRLIGVADLAAPPGPPSCCALDEGETYATIEYLSSNDRTLDCMYTPIRFCWSECDENILISEDLQEYYVSDIVLDGIGIGRVNITNRLFPTFPTLFGAPQSCLPGTPPPTLQRAVTFMNGGIQFACSDSISGAGIQKIHDAIQGQHAAVSVTLGDSAVEIGGFDFLIAYDASTLRLMDVLPGSFLTTCGWEYFTYRFGTEGNCTNNCPSGFVRIIGIAETNNGPYSPTCFVPPDSVEPEVAQLNFLVSQDRTVECQYSPVRFYWSDCGDNAVSSIDGSRLWISNKVYDFEGNDITGEPYYGGHWWLGDCRNPDTTKPSPIPLLTFRNGGVDIACADSIDARGDINLNGLGYEIADAVMFTQYFIKGLLAFPPDCPFCIPPTYATQGAIAASDVNADGIPLSVADLVYLIRVVVGDVQPYDKVSVANVSYSTDDGITITSDGEMGAVAVVVAGNATPKLLVSGPIMDYAYDATANVTRIIVRPDFENGSMTGFTGHFLDVTGDIVSIEMATVLGQPVAAKLDPRAYALSQNYPNPFNASTIIRYDLPKPATVTIKVFNIIGQVVATVLDEKRPAGSHEIVWDGSDGRGNTVASGVYYYRIEAENFTDSKVMLLLK